MVVVVCGDAGAVESSVDVVDCASNKEKPFSCQKTPRSFIHAPKKRRSSAASTSGGTMITLIVINFNYTNKCTNTAPHRLYGKEENRRFGCVDNMSN